MYLQCNSVCKWLHTYHSKIKDNNRPSKCPEFKLETPKIGLSALKFSWNIISDHLENFLWIWSTLTIPDIRYCAKFRTNIKCFFLYFCQELNYKKQVSSKALLKSLLFGMPNQKFSKGQYGGSYGQKCAAQKIWRTLYVGSNRVKW